jgi:hypothetical protein
MYAHAQLDFESRLLKGKANEYATLAERIDMSFTSLPTGISGGLPQPPRQTAAHTSISAREPVRASRNDQVQNRDLTVQSRDSHQQSDQLNAQNTERVVQSGPICRRDSDLSSLDIDMGIRRVKKKDNPYSYHIGVTGYFRRLVQLWVNKRCRRALLSAAVSMISQQMTGVNTIALLGSFVSFGI